MPRRNLYLLLTITLLSGLCYIKADGAHRSRYGRMFDTFVQILNAVEKDYVDPTRVDERDLFEGALDGMVTRLDPYSDYLPPEEATRSQEGLNQEFGGVGIELNFDPQNHALVVMNVMFGAPAHKAGMLAGDRILKINGQTTDDLTFGDAVKRLRGKVGQEVTLTVLHEGEVDPIDVVITRQIIQVASVLGDTRGNDGKWNFMLPGVEKIGYARVTTFGERTAQELQDALEELRKAGMRGLILDLRNNGGGLLNVAVQCCDLFVQGEPGNDTVVTQKRRHDEERHALSGKAPYTNFPMAVLVNQRSASASEIVAACLQDYGRATIVGQRTFGKGTVQEIVKLERGKSELRLTIAKYLRPSQKNIHRDRDSKESDIWGVQPDDGYEVKLSAEQFRNVVRARAERDAGRPLPGGNELPADQIKTHDTEDPQLKKAINAVENRLHAVPASRAA